MPTESVTLELDLQAALEEPCVETTCRLVGIAVTTLALEQDACPDWMARLCDLDNATRAGRPGVPRSLTAFAVRFGDLRIDPHWCFIAVLAVQWVGYTVLDPADGDAMTIVQSWTGVRPEHRRQGIATVLKQTSREAARAAGYRRIRTVLSRENVASLGLNAKLGFRPILLGFGEGDHREDVQ